MKIKRLFSLCSLAAVSMMSMHTSAASIDAATARLAASEFVKQHATSLRMLNATNGNGIKLAYTQRSSVEGNAYYVFNIAGGGWVIIAGDDRANQVLAYNTTGSLDMNALPSNTQAYLNLYKKQIESVQSYKGQIDVKALKAPKRATTPAGPLLKNINWAQQGPFNYQCPTYNGERSSVGCAGLAMSQIVNYWKYPTEMPALAGYQNAYYYSQVPSLPARTMDYSLIRDQYTTWTDAGSLAWVDGVTDEEKQEVAWLCRYCSQACVMNFSPDGSGSNVLKQKNAFLTLGYSDNAKLVGIEAWPSRETWNTTDYTDEQWVAMMTEQLQAGRPLPYSMEDIGDGHAFVVDGVDAEGMFHVVWGWYGRGDGWFQYGAFNVTVQNQYMEFNTALFMVIDLYPYEGYVIPGSEPQGKMGDVNNDGKVDTDDVSLIINYVLGKEAAGFNPDNADYNNDSKIDVDDVSAIIKMVLGMM